MKIAFIILNYYTLQETMECIDSIEKYIDLLPNEYRVIIVDNGSTDNSGQQLIERYMNSCIVDVLQLEKNVGFSKGNNAGIEFAKNTYDPEFYVVLNSDIELFQSNLYLKLSKEYEYSHFGLLGPMMCLADGKCDDSPWLPTTKEAVQIRLNDYEKQLKRIKNGTIIFDKVLTKLKRDVLHIPCKDTFHVHLDFWKYQRNVELQGAFLVFSRDLINIISGFDNRTFLYYEEQLLYLKVLKAGLPIVYTPDISVYHKEGRATKKVNSGRRQKELFICQCNIDSLTILLDEFKKIETGETN